MDFVDFLYFVCFLFFFFPSFLRKLGMKSTSLYIKILFITFLATFFGMGMVVGDGYGVVRGKLGIGK